MAPSSRAPCISLQQRDTKAELTLPIISLFQSKTLSLSQVEQIEPGTPGRLKVTAKSTHSEDIIEGEYNTVRSGRALALGIRPGLGGGCF